MGCALLLLFAGIFFFITYRVLHTPEAPAQRTVDKQAGALADRFFSYLDKDDVKQAYALTDSDFQNSVSLDNFTLLIQQVRKQLGKTKQRELLRFNTRIIMIGKEQITTYRLGYKTVFKDGAGAEELVVIKRGGKLSVHSYKSPVKPRFPHPQEQAPSPHGRVDPESTVQTFFKHLDKNEYSKAHAMLDEEFKKEYPIKKFKKSIGGIRKKLGERVQSSLTLNSSETIIQGSQVTVSYSQLYTTEFQRGVAREEIVLRQIDGKLFIHQYKIHSQEIPPLEMEPPSPAPARPRRPSLPGTDV